MMFLAQFLVNLTFVCVLLYVKDVEATTLQREKLLLKPIKFIDLLMQEHQRPNNPLIKERHETDRELEGKFQEVTKAMEINSEVNSGAMERKVWSRWSKWGECSATCGQGTKTRRRLCLTGRCAPGEKEEQCLPCCRQPCELD